MWAASRTVRSHPALPCTSPPAIEPAPGRASSSSSVRRALLRLVMLLAAMNPLEARARFLLTLQLLCHTAVQHARV